MLGLERNTVWCGWRGQGANLTLTNALRQKPIIMSEDQTMIRLLTALEKKTQQVRGAVGGAGGDGTWGWGWGCDGKGLG